MIELPLHGPGSGILENRAGASAVEGDKCNCYFQEERIEM